MYILPSWMSRAKGGKRAPGTGTGTARGCSSCCSMPRWAPLSGDKLSSLPDDASGWWPIAAQVVTVVILLILAIVTGRTTNQLSSAIEQQALGDLAQSDPLEVCINGSSTLNASGWHEYYRGQLRLQAQFKWPNGSNVECYHDFDGKKSGRAIFQGHGNNRLLDDVTLAAMFHCGLLQGYASGVAIAPAIRAGNLTELSTRQVDGNNRTCWVKDIAWNVQDSEATRVGLLFDNTSEYIRMNPLKRSIECSRPLLAAVNIGASNGSECVNFNGTLVDTDVSSSEWVGQPVIRVLTAPPPNSDGSGGQGDQQPAATHTEGRMVVQIIEGEQQRPEAMTWLWIAPQSEDSSRCMAETARLDAQRLLAEATTCGDSWDMGPAERKIHVSGIKVSAVILEADQNLLGTSMSTSRRSGPGGRVTTVTTVRTISRPLAYECAGGVSARSPNAATTSIKLSALRARAQAELTTTLFYTMTDQNKEDVNAVYTGILGALFGAFALVVATLFLYLIAALVHSCH